MKKMMKKMTALMIMAAVIITLAMPAMADISYNKTATFYMQPHKTSAGNSNGTGSIYINGLTGSERLKKATVKNLAPSVVKLDYINNYTYTQNKVYSDKTADIYFSLMKPGTSTISFKIGSTTYKSKVKVLKYVNPLSSLTITGINGGKTIHKNFNKDTQPDYKISKTIPNAKVTAKARKGWDIVTVSINRDSSSGTKTYRSYSGLSDCTLRNARITKGSYARITARNKSNNAYVALIINFK